MGISNTAGTVAGKARLAVDCDVSCVCVLGKAGKLYPSLHADRDNAADFAGVIGVAVTGFILDHAKEGTSRGWWQAFMLASALCWGGSALFLTSARGERLFGDLNEF